MCGRRLDCRVVAVPIVVWLPPRGFLWDGGGCGRRLDCCVVAAPIVVWLPVVGLLLLVMARKWVVNLGS